MIFFSLMVAAVWLSLAPIAAFGTTERPGLTPPPGCEEDGGCFWVSGNWMQKLRDAAAEDARRRVYSDPEEGGRIGCSRSS